MPDLHPDARFDAARVGAFIARWQASRGQEHAVYQQFFSELCDALGVPRPDPDVSKTRDYGFEKRVDKVLADGSTPLRLDFYKRGAFAIEAKQGSLAGDLSPGIGVRGSAAWQKGMREAFVQVRDYAAYLEERPPFLMTCDIGHVFEVWRGFDGRYGDYGARETIPLARLAEPEVFDLFFRVFHEPQSLNPALRALKVTRQVAEKLAALEASLKASAGVDQRRIAAFLMRCLFTMFAEDVGLLDDKLFTRLIRDEWVPHPERFQANVLDLWVKMDKGRDWRGVPLPRFNGSLFYAPEALPLSRQQLELLLDAALCDWSAVEPAIFGALFEAALDEVERHNLGAHFTPREYVERLVRPTVIEPLRGDWQIVQAQVHARLFAEGREPTLTDRKAATALLNAFLKRLRELRILDPACGTGNFLYVTFDLLKQLEAEVLRELHDVGLQTGVLQLKGFTVSPEQFLGLEVSPRAREIAELVLWIGYLQWHRRTFGASEPPEPVLKKLSTFECRDAVLRWEGEPQVRRDAAGQVEKVWDMRTLKKDPVTGLDVPDENARVPVFDYVNAREADWPEADFIVSNPPFIGNKMLRRDLGDGYTEALRAAWPRLPDTADYVLYWWDKAARAVRSGKTRRFGLITTNSLTQVFNRVVMEPHLEATESPLALAWAIGDHPWVDKGANVRIAMTVGARAADVVGLPRLARVLREEKQQTREWRARQVELVERGVPRIHADLTGGANVAAAVRLKANQGLSFQGMNLVGEGFRLTRDELERLGYSVDALPPVVHAYMNARELAQRSEGRFVIDFYGLTAEEARDRYPALYQRVLERVKPERDHNKRDSRRKNWWLFGEPVGKLRKAWVGLTGYVVTPETAKHRFFVQAGMALLPDHKLYAITSDDAFLPGVLSSRFHVTWALAAGGTLEDRPTWTSTTCFEPFPFPDATEAQKDRIRHLAERLDAHRKAVQARVPEATMTGMYNALERVRAIRRGDAGLASGSGLAPELTPVERAFHETAQIGVLFDLHADLDAAVADAYGWPADLPDEQILERLVALNTERAAEEANGTIRWLRPSLQAPAAVAQATDGDLGLAAPAKPAMPARGAPEPGKKRPLPEDEHERLAALRDLFSEAAGPLDLTAVKNAFAFARVESVRPGIELLESFGVLVGEGEGGARTWSLRAV